MLHRTLPNPNGPGRNRHTSGFKGQTKLELNAQNAELRWPNWNQIQASEESSKSERCALSFAAVSSSLSQEMATLPMHRLYSDTSDGVSFQLECQSILQKERWRRVLGDGSGPQHREGSFEFHQLESMSAGQSSLTVLVTWPREDNKRPEGQCMCVVKSCAPPSLHNVRVSFCIMIFFSFVFRLFEVRTSCAVVAVSFCCTVQWAKKEHAQTF